MILCISNVCVRLCVCVCYEVHVCMFVTMGTHVYMHVETQS